MEGNPGSQSLVSVAGPNLLAGMLNWVFFGVLSCQVYVYHQTINQDRVYLKALIYFTYLIEVAQSILLINNAWQCFVLNFGDFRVFDEVGTTWLSVCLMGGIVAFLVQALYAYRISVLSQSRVLTTFIILMAFVSWTGSLGTAIIMRRLQHFSNILDHKTIVYSMIGLWEVTGSVCDVVIAICMIYHIRQMSSRGGTTKTQQLVSRIVTLTIETGTLTATISIVSVTLFYVFNPKAYYQVPLTLIGKLYSNTMLVVVNSRVRYKAISESTTWGNVDFNSRDFARTNDDSDEFRIDMPRRKDEPDIGSMTFAMAGEGSRDSQALKMPDFTTKKT